MTHVSPPTTRRRGVRAVLVAVVVLLGGALARPAEAADADTELPQNMAVWMMQVITTDLKLGRPMGPLLWLELHERRIPPGAFTINGPGVGWDFGHNVTLWAGYYWQAVFGGVANTEVGRLDEHVLFQQVQASGDVGLANLSGRLRPEERWVVGNDGWSYRLRTQFRAGLAFKKTWGLATWDELWLLLNQTALGPKGFEQNRLFVGPYFQGPKGVRVEIGYMNQLQQIPGAPTLTMNHVAAANLFVNIQAKKKAPPPPPNAPAEQQPKG